MKPRFVPQLTVERLPADYASKPDYVVLDFAEPIRQYLADIEQTVEHEYPVDEVIGELLIYLSPCWIAPEGLESLALDLQEKFPLDGVHLATAVTRLGKSLQRQLEICKAYTEDGLLHYEVEPIEHWLGGLSPVLVKRALTVTARNESPP